MDSQVATLAGPINPTASGVQAGTIALNTLTGGFNIVGLLGTTRVLIADPNAAAAAAALLAELMERNVTMQVTPGGAASGAIAYAFQVDDGQANADPVPGALFLVLWEVTAGAGPVAATINAGSPAGSAILVASQAELSGWALCQCAGAGLNAGQCIIDLTGLPGDTLAMAAVQLAGQPDVATDSSVLP